MQPGYRSPQNTGNIYGNLYGYQPQQQNPNMGGMGGIMPSGGGVPNQPVLDRGTIGYSNATLGMMVQKTGNMAMPGNGNMNPQQLSQEKERQLQQLKTQFPNVQHKQVISQGQPVDLVELSMQIQTPDAHLQIPMALILDSRFPTVAPKIFIRSKLKHNLFEVKDQIIEFDVNNIMPWSQNANIIEGLNRAKAVFEKDPPKQEKIIEDVNKLLSVVSEQNFKNLVVADHFSQRSADELRLLQGISFQELICSSSEYKKIGQNLIDVVNFNEKVANELLQKKEDLEQHKQSLLQVSARIEGLTRDYNERANRCKGFKDAFSRQNIDGFVTQEIKNLDSQSLNLEAIAQNQHGNILDIFQNYLDTRKNYHRLNIVKIKLPELNYQ